MSASPSPVVEAAGGVLWRQEPRGLEVALVHRPKYDDWSLPKGKLLPGEPVLLGALREIREETGHRAALGRPLGQLNYVKEGEPKRVRYWAVSARDGRFEPSDEIDDLRWFDPDVALDRLSPGHDRPILRTFLHGPLKTWPFVLVRHANAVDRGDWHGSDDARPLDERGHLQTRLLTDILRGYEPAAVFSAPRLRCTATLRPLADAEGLDLTREPLLAEESYFDDPDAVVAWAIAIAREGRPVAACSQGGPVPSLAERLSGALGGSPVDLSTTDKGGFVVVHLTDSRAPRVVDVEAFPAPA
jgi:8-oxo-dGTP diphosphatase